MSRAAIAALGSVPALLFVAYVTVAAQRGRAADGLWVCHFANLLLALGLFAGSRRVIGLAAALLLAGFPLWALDSWRNGEVTLVSAASHLGGLAVALYALSRVRLSFNPWLAALIVFVALRELCRWVTPEALNVNLAHAAYAGWEDLPGGYAAYWLATTVAAGAALWGAGRVLSSLFKEGTP